MSGPGDFARAAYELVADRGAAGAAQAVRLVIGRIAHGIGPERALLFDLAGEPLQSWPSYVTTSDFAPFFRFVNNARGSTFWRDKVRTAERCAEYGVPMLPIIAVAGRAEPGGGSFRAFGDAKPLEAFLAGGDMPSRAFFKPAGDHGGAGAFRAERTAGGWWVGDAELTCGDLAERLLTEPDVKGMLIQPRATAPAAMRYAGGERALPTIRVQTALTESGPVVVYAIQKIIVGDTVVDNFSSGAKGNLVAAIDPDRGMLGKAYGRPAGRRLLISPFTANPGNGEPIEGRAAVGFADVVDVARRTALAFPELPLLGIDIAVTEDGAVVVETNNSPDQLLAQIACRRGGRSFFAPLMDKLAIDSGTRRRAIEMLGQVGDTGTRSHRN